MAASMDLTGELQDVAGRDLVADIARQFGEVRLKVKGVSMLPALWPGDVLTVRRASPADLRPGRILLCYGEQGFVAHRFVGRRGDLFVTRGDALPREDRPFREDQVLGQVVAILRDGRSVSPSPVWWHGAAAWILRYSELCTRMLLRLRRSTCAN